MTSKLLKIVLIILLIITLIEAGYFINLKFSKNSNNNFLNQNNTVFPTISINPTVVANKAIDPQVIEIMKSYYNDPNTKVTVKTETTTTISDIAKEGIEFRGTFYPFALKITSGVEGVKPFWIYFQEFFKAKTKVYQKIGSELKEISFNDLNIEDRIIMIEEYDPAFPPADPNQLISEKIYKLE